MSELFAAIGIGALILLPITILTIVISVVAVNRGEENTHTDGH